MKHRLYGLRKVLGGSLVVLASAVLPWPALADASVATPPESAATSNASPATDPAPEAAPTPPVVTAPPTSVETEVPVSPPTAAAATPAPTTVPAPKAEVQIEKHVDSAATSGVADVTNNETAGNATSGGATAQATVLNVANDSGVTAGNFQTFQCDITQDLQQNIVIDPATLQPLPYCTHGGVSNGTPIQPSATPADMAASTNGLQTGDSLVRILNDIVLSAASGNATVSDNGQAGNATTGDATALANVVNIANTAISSRNSFLGVINVYGELKGDILVPQSFVDSLAHSNSRGSGAGYDTSVDSTVSTTAASGNASVVGNGTSGDATSGDARTSLTVLNLTGQEVVAKNSLLVFVNVLGKWMGMIVPAPDSHTAMLGGGIQSGQPGIATGENTQEQVGQVTTSITNNISVDAQTGDANVARNGTAGDATSGTARAGANLLNITDSNFWLEDWFGALFINVLGSWLGDFDIQANAPAAAGSPLGPAGQPPVQDVRVFRFTAPATIRPSGTTANPSSEAPVGEQTAAPTTEPQAPGEVLAGSDTDFKTDSVYNSPKGGQSAGLASYVIPGLSVATASGITLAAIRRHRMTAGL